MSVKVETDIQKRFADVDILGHVNNVNLQHYFDVGKTDFFEKVLGVRPSDNPALGIIIASAQLNYLEQTRPHDRVFVETSIEKIGTKSITIYQRLIGRDDGMVRADCRSVSVAFDFKRQVSVEVPQEWKKAVGL